jgi:hypothetical protein
METLEEAAERFYPPTTTDLICSPKLVRDAFIAGGNYMAEKMYTYDELRRLAYNAFCLSQIDNPTENKYNGWIEQFKK